MSQNNNPAIWLKCIKTENVYVPLISMLSSGNLSLAQLPQFYKRTLATIHYSLI